MPKIHCPVESCGYWVGDDGYTLKSLDQLKTHVLSAHPDLTPEKRRREGGIVDEMVSKALAFATVGS
jgi:hypothetical protein